MVNSIVTRLGGGFPRNPMVFATSGQIRIPKKKKTFFFSFAAITLIYQVVVSNMFFFHFNLGKTPIMTT